MRHITTTIIALALCNTMSAQKLTDYVDPAIGTGDHGHVFIGANVPFGMVQAGPTQLQYSWDWCSGYHHSSDSIIGFSQLHLSGTGCADLGDIALMPMTGSVTCSRVGLAHTFSHSTEDAHAGYYAVTLNGKTPGSKGVRCEMTATKRVALHRYTYLDASAHDRSLVIDLENATGTWDRTLDCRFQQLDANTIIGFRDSHGWADRQQLCFAIQFSKPINSIDLREGVRKGAKGKQYAVVTFSNDNGTEPLLVKVALSPTSEANALLNMQTELPGWDFDATRKAADAAWEQELGRITATFPTQRESRIFYTSMFHLMVAPQLWNDCNGDYLDVTLHTRRNADYQHLTTWSLWDTYRAVHPLSTIIFADRSRDYAHTMMDIYRGSHELPVWHLMSNETYCMVGEPAVPVLADIILKGQNADVDAEEAYQAMLVSLEYQQRTPTATPHDSRAKDLIMQYGYIPFDLGQSESVAKNMEYFLAYWSAAQVAGRLGHKEDSIHLTAISHNYKKLYDPRVGFMRALSKDGKFRSIEGFNPCHQTKDYTEGNPWQYTFLVPHDVDGLVELLGGKKAFEKKLDDLFIADSDLGENANPDVTGLIGQYAHGNEPSHHVLYMYNYIGRPQKAQRMIRRVMDELYDDQPAGLCGNEDVGQMSAWYIMSALGFYQVEPCGGKYQLGCPAVKEARINVGGGKAFTVRTQGNQKRAIVKRWKLNGKPLNRTYIMHDEIMRGGCLEAIY